MFNATYFTYDGVFSGVFGLVLADFNTNAVVETSAFSPTLNTTKPASINRFFHNGIRYEAPPQHQFSVVSEKEIQEPIRREILSWLVGRNEFKKLQIHQVDLEEYYYLCVFSNVDIIYVNGRCHGFRLTANFDSPFAHGRETSKTLAGNSGISTMTINNKSDLLDEYVYPTIQFSATSVSTGDTQATAWAESQDSLATFNGNNKTPLSNYDICIVNKTDDVNRRFIFAGLLPGEIITVNNELRCISSSVSGEKLKHFNKNWLRLRRGYNELEIEINGDVTITCPHYAMIGF